MLKVARGYLVKIQHIETELMRLKPDTALQQELQGWIAHALRQIDQTERRVLNGEVIPHHEKVFSLFEPHTEWISKGKASAPAHAPYLHPVGKAGVPVELGVKVCVMEDQYRFILQHRVMQQETDDKVAVTLIKEAQAKFPDFHAASFDTSFHSPQNQAELAVLLQQITLPRKGKLSQTAREHQQTDTFKQARRQHAAVESAINALEVHGLNVCPDQGIEGFKRYVAFAVLTRNIHRLGDIVWQQDQTRERRRQTANQGHDKRRSAA